MDIAKLRRPRVHRVYARERLYARLDEALVGSVVWIAAPPGAGKTSLVTGYLAARRRKNIWYGVDAADADPANLFLALREGLKGTGLRGAELPPRLSAEYAEDIDGFARQFFRLFHAALPRRAFLVLDNCHEAQEASSFVAALAHAVAEIRDDVGLVLISRQVHPQRFNRLRSQGTVTLIGPDEMRLTADESAGLQALHARNDLAVGAETARRRHELTHGWAAGLVLLMEEDRARGTGTNVVMADYRDVIYDYLADEIFERQHPDAQVLMLKMALLPLIRPSTAERLTGNGKAGQILESLFRHNHFTQKRGSDDPIYEFHPLMRDFLIARGRTAFDSSQRSALLHTAADLLEADDQLDAAAALLQETGDGSSACAFVVRHAATLLAQSRHRTLMTWIDKLPPEAIAADPWVMYWHGVALGPFDPPGARARYERAYELFTALGDELGRLLGWSAIVENITLEWADFGQLDHWLEVAEKLPTPETAPLSPEASARYVASRFGALMFRRPEHPEIEQWAVRLHELVRQAPNPEARILLGCNLYVYYAVLIGDHTRLDHLIAEMKPAADAILTPGAAVLWHTVAAGQYWLKGRMDACREAVAVGRRLVRDKGVRLWDFLITSTEAYASLTAGDPARGTRDLETLRAVLDTRRKVDVNHYHYLAALAALQQGRPIDALQHALGWQETVERNSGTHQVCLGHLAKAQILHAAGRRKEARESLDAGLRTTRQMRSPICEFQGRLCEALFALDESDPSACSNALQQALSLGAQQGYLNYNWFRPDMMARLCAFALEHGIEPAYATHLIRERHLVPPSPEAETWPWAVRVFTLGRFSVTLDEHPIDTRGKAAQKPLELLQVLIALNGRDIAVEKLIDTLWPDAESKGGRGALESTLHRLRRLLGHDDAIVLDGGRLTLNDRLCWVDAWACARHLNVARRAIDKLRSLTELIAALDAALRLYHGEFLIRETDQSWMLSLRNRLHSRLEQSLDAGGKLLQDADLWPAAARLYRRALEVDPHKEDWYRRLMVCLREQGETAEALQTYEQCRKALGSGRGAVPSRHTETIRKSLLISPR